MQSGFALPASFTLSCPVLSPSLTWPVSRVHAAGLSLLFDGHSSHGLQTTRSPSSRSYFTAGLFHALCWFLLFSPTSHCWSAQGSVLFTSPRSPIASHPPCTGDSQAPTSLRTPDSPIQLPTGISTFMLNRHLRYVQNWIFPPKTSFHRSIPRLSAW